MTDYWRRSLLDVTHFRVSTAKLTENQGATQISNRCRRKVDRSNKNLPFSYFPTDPGLNLQKKCVNLQKKTIDGRNDSAVEKSKLLEMWVAALEVKHCNPETSSVRNSALPSSSAEHPQKWDSVHFECAFLSFFTSELGVGERDVIIIFCLISVHLICFLIYRALAKYEPHHTLGTLYIRMKNKQVLQK